MAVLLYLDLASDSISVGGSALTLALTAIGEHKARTVARFAAEAQRQAEADATKRRALQKLYAQHAACIDILSEINQAQQTISNCLNRKPEATKPSIPPPPPHILLARNLAKILDAATERPPHASTTDPLTVLFSTLQQSSEFTEFTEPELKRARRHLHELALRVGHIFNFIEQEMDK